MSLLNELQEIFFKEDAARSYLLANGIIGGMMECPKCGGAMKLNEVRWVFRCRKETCDVLRSLNSNTFFAGTKLKACEVLLLSRLWLAKVPVSSAIELTGHSEKTVVAFWGHFRQLVSSALEEEDTVIGGDGIIVEVDETKLGKRKYHKGHHV